MITVSDLSLSFNGQDLFKHVDLKFTPGNCYGIIGANGAGKSTFLKILSRQLEPSTGTVSIPPKLRLSVLKQDHFAYNEYTVLDTVIMGNQKLYDIGREKDALYLKENFTDEDGIRAAELEGLYAEMGGWEAESNASRLIQGLGLSDSILYSQMSAIADSEKVKVLLAQALFGEPDIILLDEPTNQLDTTAIDWLEEFLIEYPGTVIVVSHDRYFLNNVCTHIVDIDYNQIKMYVGNYEFWYESSQLMQRLIKAQNKRAEERISDLQNFIARFSANKSKSRQATSRKKLLEKLTIEELPASSRRYPFVGFVPDREIGKEVLEVDHLCKDVEGETLLTNITFRLGRTDKVCLLSENELSVGNVSSIYYYSLTSSDNQDVLATYSLYDNPRDVYEDDEDEDKSYYIYQNRCAKSYDNNTVFGQTRELTFCVYYINDSDEGDKELINIVEGTFTPELNDEDEILTNEEFKALNSNYKGYNKEFYQDSYNAFIRPKIIKTGLLTFGITLLLCGLLAFIWLYEPKATENAKSKSTKKKR